MEIEELKKQMEEQAEQIKNLTASKSRLESENSKVKTRAQEAEGKLTEAEKQKMEDEGKLQERLDLEKNEKLELQKKFEVQKSTVLTEKLKGALAKACPDAHGNSIDLMLNVKEHRALLKVDDDALTVDGVEDFVGKLRETHSFFFTKSKLPETEDKKPDGKGLDEPLSDIEKYSKELKACKSQTEMDAVMLKHGRL